MFATGISKDGDGVSALIHMSIRFGGLPSS